MSSPAPSNPLDQLQELAQEQASFKAELESFKEQIRLGKEIADLRAEFNKTVGSTKLFMTLIPITFAIVAFLAGTVGYKSFRDIARDAEKKIEAQSARELSLSRAYASLSHKEYDTAIRLFEEHFEVNPYDATVAMPLLNAYDETDNWEDAEKRIQKLEANEQKLSKINNPNLLNSMGLIRIQEGVDDPAKLKTGLAYLRRSARFIPGDDVDALTNLHINLWLAALAEQDMPKAEQEASLIAVPDSTVTLDEWYKVRRWRFFRRLLAKKPKLEPEIAKMWNAERKSLADMHTTRK